ncbi:MAG: hypothetical protein JSR46_04865 [Verrucomicrobia bacterium]|nr:hypothetical protein [Verrucomicrobiota bacterium]
MNLLQAFILIVNMWRPAFCKLEAFYRAREHAVAALCSFGHHTITSIAIFLGRDRKKPSADYKLYSWCKWKVEKIFNPLLGLCLHFFEEDYIIIGADDTKLKKTGKKIAFASWQRDPMSPPFHVNFIWALRFLQFSVLMPLYKRTGVPCRAVPIRFIEAHAPKRPGKKASEEQKKDYRELQKKYNLSCLFVKEVRNIREAIDREGGQDKKLLMVCDGSFCNQTCMGMNIDRVYLTARCRKDAKLCRPFQGEGRKIYDDKKFTPEEVRQDDSIVWHKKAFFYGGEWREIRYKEVNKILWSSGAKRRLLRLVVIAPLPYVRRGKRNYRQPAYLLSTDIEGSIELLLQAYLDRVQIEYNHREEKSILGIGEAQVRNERSVSQQPALCVAAYSALLLASILAYEDKPHPDFGEEPLWRPQPKHNSCRALIGLLRISLLEHPEKIIELGIPPPIITAILRKAA